MSNSSPDRSAAYFGVVSLVALLSACYVVPMDARTGQPAMSSGVSPASSNPPPTPVVFSARLYPANDAASRYGIINSTVTNDLHGRGSFNASINGESFVGEATRSSTGDRSGLASGAGNRGSYLSCRYSMNNATQGNGRCRLSDGAEFTMHVGH